MNKYLKTGMAATLISVCVALSPLTLPGLTTSALAESEHKSVLRIGFNEQLPLDKSITVGFGKTTVVEFPRELRDVVVSNPAILDAVVQSSTRVYLIGKTIGAANVFFFDENGEQSVTLEVNVERDASQLEEIVARLVPGSNVDAELMNDNIILNGTVVNPSDAGKVAELASRYVTNPGDVPNPARVINLLRAEGKEQVMLKVTIAEVNRETVKRFGVNLSAIGGDTMGFVTNNTFPITGFTGQSSYLFGASGPGKGGCPIPGPQSGNLVPAGTVAGSPKSCLARTLEAFERHGLLRTLAEPTLTAISGEAANFLAGGEFPIPVAAENNNIKIQFKPFGVSLAFTPLVLSEDRISLKLSTEVSEISSEGSISAGIINIPGLKVRRTDTTVELPSGGSLVIAGLISDESRQNIDGVPGLKKLPILGALFRSRDFVKNKSELLVIVTPYVVNPVHRSQLARPDDGLEAASDINANFLGQINKVYGRQEALPEGDYEGKFGFMVE